MDGGIGSEPRYDVSQRNEGERLGDVGTYMTSIGLDRRRPQPISRMKYNQVPARGSLTETITKRLTGQSFLNEVIGNISFNLVFHRSSRSTA